MVIKTLNYLYSHKFVGNIHFLIIKSASDKSDTSMICNYIFKLIRRLLTFILYLVSLIIKVL